MRLFPLQKSMISTAWQMCAVKSAVCLWIISVCNWIHHLRQEAQCFYREFNLRLPCIGTIWKKKKIVWVHLKLCWQQICRCLCVESDTVQTHSSLSLKWVTGEKGLCKIWSSFWPEWLLILFFYYLQHFFSASPPSSNNFKCI